METSRFQVVTMSKIYDRPKISARMPHNIACESLIDECSSRACSAHQLGRKYEIFGGKNLPFYRCSKHHRLLDKSFVSALTVSRDTVGLTNEYILLGASKSPILKLEGFICSVPGKICNLDPRALIDEDRMLNEYGEDYKRDFSITLTTTTSIESPEIELVQAKINKQNRKEQLGIHFVSFNERPGVFVYKVLPDSKFQDTSIMAGMKILEINGQKCPERVSETISLLNSIVGDIVVSASIEIGFKDKEKVDVVPKLIPSSDDSEGAVSISSGITSKSTGTSCRYYSYSYYYCC